MLLAISPVPGTLLMENDPAKCDDVFALIETWIGFFETAKIDFEEEETSALPSLVHERWWKKKVSWPGSNVWSALADS